MHIKNLYFSGIIQQIFMAVEKSKPAQLKTKETVASVADFVNSIAEEQKRKDSFAIIEMMKKATKEEPKMWGSAIIGFGNIKLKSPNTGREIDWMKIGFSPRKANLALYVGIGSGKHEAALKKLGKHKTGKGCLYINKLEDIDLTALKTIIETTLKGK